MEKTIEEIGGSNFKESPIIDEILSSFDPSQASVLIIIVGAYLLLSALGDKHKNKLATGYWGSSKVKKAAKEKALSQMRKKSRNSVALYIGTPSESDLKKFK